ncbi:MAG: TRAP transporter permease DctM/Q, partial [Pseudomonadota bacterium]
MTAAATNPPAEASRGRGWAALGLVVVVFHLGLVFWGLAPNLVARPLHLALALPFVLIASAKGPTGRASGVALAAAGVAICIWIASSHDALGDQYGYLEGDAQLFAAAALLLIVLEAARRA